MNLLLQKKLIILNHLSASVYYTTADNRGRLRVPLVSLLGLETWLAEGILAHHQQQAITRPLPGDVVTMTASREMQGSIVHSLGGEAVRQVQMWVVEMVTNVSILFAYVLTTPRGNTEIETFIETLIHVDIDRLNAAQMEKRITLAEEIALQTSSAAKTEDTEAEIENIRS